MKHIKYHTVGTVPKSNRKIVEKKRQINTSNTQIFPIGAVIGIKSGGVTLVLRAQASLLSEIRGSCKCFPRVNKMLNVTQ